MPVLDIGSLGRFLEGRLPGLSRPITAQQFRGGQSNPTYLLTAGEHAYVLRHKPHGPLLPSAHAIEREYRVLTALRGHGVPIPDTYLLCEDAAVIGSPFYVMEYVAGDVVTDAALPGRSPADRRAIYDSMASVLARLHTVDWHTLGLADFGRPGNYVARQVHRWTAQYRASETERIEAMEKLIAWLPAHVPAGEEEALVHGDFRPGNLVIHPTEPKVVAILDWELSTIGHPLVDLGHHALLFRTGPEDFGAFGDRPAPDGIPSEAEHLATYCRLTNRVALPHWDYYVAFAMFRFAAIFQGIMGRVVAGTATDPGARQAGMRARPLAERAWRLVSGQSQGVHQPAVTSDSQ